MASVIIDVDGETHMSRLQSPPVRFTKSDNLAAKSLNSIGKKTPDGSRINGNLQHGSR